MISYWVDPPVATDPRKQIRLWDAVSAFMQPPVKRVVKPLGRARIVIPTSVGVDLCSAVWGLVPKWATSGERRQLAKRHATLDALLAPESNITGDLWSASKPAQRCLVLASGWVGPAAGGVLVCQPETSPLMFAGLYSVVHVDRAGPVTTFGVFCCSVSHSPYDGSSIPIVVRAEDRLRWLACAPAEAKGFLRPPGMKVYTRRVADTAASDRALFGTPLADDAY
ncbi:SOS response-associated peptidase family protein [Tahibacter harae]|uniref:SOS response-associated peptidase n=1 Tax=Tahibacter harae TaxID=2963937 RepID=A0ABT1QS69_9GAMM|nr:SOS response-associated peptidase family protein [Tahibacter harae]MCQ4165151.1 SOS response-associated peptidase [Tahibacter harae]